MITHQTNEEAYEMTVIYIYIYIFKYFKLKRKHWRETERDREIKRYILNKRQLVCICTINNTEFKIAFKQAMLMTPQQLSWGS